MALRLSLRGSFPKQSVYYEIFRDVRNAISREKQIKGGSRAKKIELINGMNAGLSLRGLFPKQMEGSL